MQPTPTEKLTTANITDIMQTADVGFSASVAIHPSYPRTDNVAHLTYRQKTNLGSFYTPPRLVCLLYDVIARNIPANSADTVLESACGYGAFFAEKFPQPNARLIGADIDSDALAIARRQFPKITIFNANALAQISRAKYGIRDNERLIIIGNPPYNDVTSHVKNRIKAAPCEIDASVRTRDLGLSFLLAAAKLSPDYIALLHPLSYLIKETNFKILAPLMRDYSLRDAVVFNSQEFAETSKGCGFPIVAAVYAKNSSGTTYEQIRHRQFRTIEGSSFSISDYDYVSRYITKYPTRFPSTPSHEAHFRFYTMRDINALKRSRTFITEDTANAIHIIPEKLPYYCYVDAFKDIAGTLPYYLGNLDIMINHPAFEPLKNDFLTVSVAKHPAIFSTHFSAPDTTHLRAAQEAVRHYFKKLFQNIKPCS